MNPRCGSIRMWLTVSLFLNAGFLLSVVYRTSVHSDPAVRAGEVGPVAAAADPGVESASEKEIAPGTSGSKADREHASTFRRLLAEASGDPERFVKFLADAGLTTGMIRGVITAHIATKHDQTVAEVLYPEGANYWEALAGVDSEEYRELRARQGAESRMFQAMLAELPRSESEAERLEREWRFGDIPPAKVALLRDTVREYENAKSESLQVLQDSRASPREKLKIREAYRNALLDAVHAQLTAEEYREFELRQSEFAQELMEQLAPIAVSENEYEALYDLKRDFDQRFKYSAWDIELHAERAWRGAEIAIATLDLLGPKRGATYLRNRYPDLSRLEAALPEQNVETHVAVYRIQMQAVRDAARMGAEPEWSAGERIAAAEELIGSIRQELRDLFGETGAEEIENTVYSGRLDGTVYGMMGAPMDQFDRFGNRLSP